MIPRWFERLSVLILLLIAVWLRVWHLTDTPAGFSNDEIHHIQVIEQIRQGTVQVFFANETGSGEESLYHILNMITTQFVGDGLLGFRLFSVWVNLLALAFLYAAARMLFGTGIALVSMAIMISGIAGLLLSRSIDPVALMPLLIAATLAAFVWAFHLYQPIQPFYPQTLRFTILGTLIAASIYTHYTGLLLLLILLLFVVYLYWTEQPVSRLIWSSSLFALTLILVLILPYIISVLREPSRSGGYVLWRDRPGNLVELGDSFVATLGAFFLHGDSHLGYNVPSLPLLFPFWSILTLVGLIVAIQRWREPAFGLLLIMLVVGLLPDLWMWEGPDFAALLVVKPVLFILAGLGAYTAAQFVQENTVSNAWQYIAALIGVGFLWTGWQGYQRVLVDWVERPDVQVVYHTPLAKIAHYLDTDSDPMPTLLCSDTLRNRVLSDDSIQQGDPVLIDFMLHRDNLNLRFADCRRALVLINGGQQMRVIWLNPGNIAEMRPEVEVWMEAPQSTSEMADAFDIETVDQLAAKGGQLQLNSRLMYPLMGSQEENVILPVRFGRNMTLLGYEATLQSVYLPGDIIWITTYWRIEGALPTQVGIFERLHDTPQSSPYTEMNGLDVRVSDLQSRDVIVQTSYLVIPDNLLPGEYVITLGVYDNNPLNQITVFDVAVTETRGNYLMLADRIHVEARNAED